MRIALEDGDVNISPQTAPVSIPLPMYPMCAGSWPDPPPRTFKTFSNVFNKEFEQFCCSVKKIIN